MGMNHPRAPPLAHGAPGGFGLLPAPMNLGMGGMGQPPPPPPMQQALNQQAFGDHAVASGNDYDQRIIEHDDRDRRDYRRDDRERRDRGRDRERDRDRDRDSSSRRGERERDRRRSRSRSRSRDRGRDRSRDRSSRRRSSRDRDRSPRRDRRDRSLSRSSDDEERGMGPEFHNSTIMVRGLAQHIMENDIRGDITDCGLRAKDIRLIRKKESGASRGFAFVEFGALEDAVRWMDAKQGVLVFKDRSRATMQYSLPRDGRQGDMPRVLHDWICGICGVQNFRRRESCFKCNEPRRDTEDGPEGEDEVSQHPTNTVLLRGLDTLTTEDSVLATLRDSGTELPLKSLRIGRDSATSLSRGVCYVEMNSVSDAMFLHNRLLGEPPTIDDRLVGVSYYRSPQNAGRDAGTPAGSSAASAAMAAAQWSHQGKEEEQQGGALSDDEIEKMARSAAEMYGKTAEEKAHYLEYYRDYYKNGGSAPDAAGDTKRKTESDKDLGKATVNGVEYKKYPAPDVSTYTYEETSGYYYDASTGLYYDAKSQYYFNSKTKEYMYWSAEHSTYLPANATANGAAATKNEPEEGTVVDKKKVEKVKTAKQQKKKEKSAPSPAPEPEKSKIERAREALNRSEDIAFSIMQGKQPMQPDTPSSSSSMRRGAAAGLDRLTGYGSDSAEEEPQQRPSAAAAMAAQAAPPSDEQLTDWGKMACLLCQRQFPTKEKLQKHNKVSDLHKQNLAEHHRKFAAALPAAAEDDSLAQTLQYRDRAKERRQKFGADDAPKPNRLKEKYLRAVDHMESSMVERAGGVDGKQKIGSDNKGNKMLQKW